MPFDFSGKKVLVTGAGRDLGRAIAKAIAAAGGEVYALGRNKENIESLVRECDNIHPVIVDLSDWEATREELTKLPVLHGVVNNASSVPLLQRALDVGVETLREAINVTTLAPINVIQVTAKKMIENAIHGSIVNVSRLLGWFYLKVLDRSPMKWRQRPAMTIVVDCDASRVKQTNLPRIKEEAIEFDVSAISAMVPFFDSNVPKAGLDMVTKQFALELGPHQIRVNSVNPTWILTNAVKEYLIERPEKEEQLKSTIPLGRIVEVREVVEPIMYLLSDHSSMVSGTAHVVDGGLSSNIPV